MRREQLAQLLKEYNYLLEEKGSLIDQLTEIQVSNVKKRFDDVLDSLNGLRNRIICLNQVICISTNADTIAHKLRNLSANNARNFISKYGTLSSSSKEEKDDGDSETSSNPASSLRSALGEQANVIEQMKMFELEIQELNKEAIECTNSSMLHLPSIVHEKLTTAQEVLRQSLNEENERRVNLLEMLKSNDQKRTKLDALTQNLELIERILSNKNPNEPIATPRKTERKVSFSREDKQQVLQAIMNGGNSSNSNNCNSVAQISDGHESDENNTNIKHKDYAKYLERLRKCKEIVSTSKRLLADLMLTASQSLVKLGFFFNLT